MYSCKGCIMGRFFSRPVAGFSIIKIVGSKNFMMSGVRDTNSSACARFLGVFALALAIEYWVHGGEA
jgi:small neutral amino acid transporter SnatA (MarC family)